MTVPTVEIWKFQKSKMAAAAIWKNGKIAIPRINGFTDRHEIWYGDTY